MAGLCLSLTTVITPACSCVPFQEVRKEGYLWKINKRKKRRIKKFFVLVGGSLTWSMKPTVPDRLPFRYPSGEAPDQPLLSFCLPSG